MAGLDEAEIAANRRGASGGSLAAAAVEFAVGLARQRGQIADAEIEAARAAGLSDEMIVEIIRHVALNTFTNYVNRALGMEIDFPRIDGGRVA